MPIKKTKGKSGSAKPSDILTWSVCLGSPTKEIKVFEVSFSEQNLRKALNGIYDKSYSASRGGGAFLKKAGPIVQQELTSVGRRYSEEAIRNYFCKRLPDAVANKVLCRLSEKLRSRLLSIITEAQLAVERAHEIAAGLTEEKTKLLIDEIYGSSYKLTCGALGIQRGRRAETRKQFIQKQCTVLRKLGSQPLSQVNLAAEQGTDPANLRKRMRFHGIETHQELLKFCGFR